MAILMKVEPAFCVRPFFIYKTGKMSVMFNVKKLNNAVATPPRSNMKSHKTITLSALSMFGMQLMISRILLLAQKSPLNASRTWPSELQARPTFIRRSPSGFFWNPFIAHICVDQITKGANVGGHKVTHYLQDFHYFGKDIAAITAVCDLVRAPVSASWEVAQP